MENSENPETPQEQPNNSQSTDLNSKINETLPLGSSIPRKIYVAPTIPQIIRPNFNIPLNMSDIDKNKIITASLAVPLCDAQITVGGLEQFTQTEIKTEWKKILSQGPPNTPFDPNIPPSLNEFDLEEDVFLLIYLRLSSSDPSYPLNQFLQDFPLKPIHSIASIKDRLLHLSQLSEEEQDSKFQDLSQLISYEKVFFGPQKTEYAQPLCYYNPLPKVVPTPESEIELKKLSQKFPLFTYSKFGPSDLAILRSENYIYYMRREAILIGRHTIDHHVDVDLNFETHQFCTHISRAQAVLSFQDDYKFYLENVGNRTFRVNGVLIPSTGVCCLPPGALLDFSGALLLFIPNQQLINELISYVENSQKPSKQKL